MLITLFRKAGATGNVFYIKNGKVRNKGIAFSSLIGPMTTVAIVPTTTQPINFEIETTTMDNQQITVQGDVKIKFNVEKAISQFDFSVNPQTGSPASAWDQQLSAAVIAAALSPIHEKAGTLGVEAAVKAQKAFEDALEASLKVDQKLAGKGIVFESCSIPTITAVDEAVAEALGSKEREKMLSDADKARHERQMDAAKNARAVKKYESATALTLETDRAKIVAEQSKNKLQEATGDAAATEKRLEPLLSVEAGKVLAFALVEGLKNNRVGTIVIGPELYGALQGK